MNDQWASTICEKCSTVNWIYFSDRMTAPDIYACECWHCKHKYIFDDMDALKDIYADEWEEYGEDKFEKWVIDTACEPGEARPAYGSGKIEKFLDLDSPEPGKTVRGFLLDRIQEKHGRHPLYVDKKDRADLMLSYLDAPYQEDIPRLLFERGIECRKYVGDPGKGRYEDVDPIHFKYALRKILTHLLEV